MKGADFKSHSIFKKATARIRKATRRENKSCDPFLDKFSIGRNHLEN